MMPSASPEKAITQEQLSTLMGMNKELGGYSNELLRLSSPEKVKVAINEMSAAAVGLPTSVAWEKVTFPVFEHGKFENNSSNFSTISTVELMQLFLAPDFSANSRGAGYYAQTALDTALLGTTRDAVLRGVTGPGRYTEKEALDIVNSYVSSGKIKPEDADNSFNTLNGSVKFEALAVAKTLVEEAPRVNARGLMFKAYGEYAAYSGDEEAGSKIFIQAGHAAPIGPDFQAFFSGDGDKRDKAMRQIYAAGLSYEELHSTGKDDLLIEGIHFKWSDQKPDQTFDKVPISNNVYANGFNSETFKNWIDAILVKTDGDLLAAYDCWYTGIATGLVAKVGGDGVKVGDPPWVSSLDAWLMHFGKKQLAEAGRDANGKRTKLVDYKNKTGPAVGVGRYQPEWVGSFFDNAKLGKTNPKDTIFDRWWNKGVSLSDIPWNVIDQNAGKTEEEVKLTGFDGYLYTKMQMFKLLETIQKVPPLGEIGKLTYWQGIARTLDKAFGTVYEEDTTDNRVKATDNGVAVAQYATLKRDKVDFIKVVPDNKNPRIPLIMGLLDRYRPGIHVARSPSGDTSGQAVDRFSMITEDALTFAANAKDLKSGEPGAVSIETFVVSVVKSGLLTYNQMFYCLVMVYGKGDAQKIYNGDKVQAVSKY